MVARWWPMLVATAMLLLGGGAQAQSPSATLRADTDTLVVGQTIGLLMIVEGGEPAGVPRIPVGRGLSVKYRQMSTSVSIVNGIASRVVHLGFELTGEQEGEFRVGPAGVQLRDGRTVSASPITVSVEPRTISGDPDDIPPLTVSARFLQDRVWQGQVVLYEELLRTRVGVASHRWHGRPEKGLLIPASGRPEEQSSTLQDERGPIRHVARRWPLIAREVGTHTYDPTAVEIEVLADEQPSSGILGFFRRTRREVLRTEPLTLQIDPLPPAPEGFTGLVGDFEVRSHLVRRQVRVGQSIPWRIDLTGTGTLEGMQPPDMDLPDGIRVYDTPAQVRGHVRNQTWNGAATFEREIVPTQPGDVTLPDLTWVVFSPTKGDYQRVTVEGVQLTVLPGDEGDVDLESYSPPPPPTLEADPSAPAGPQIQASGPGLVLPWAHWMPLAWGLAGLPALGMGLVQLRDTTQRTLAQLQARRALAPRTLDQRLADLPDHADARLAALARWIRDTDTERSDELRALLDEVDAVRFAGSSPADDLESRLVDALRRLEQP